MQHGRHEEIRVAGRIGIHIKKIFKKPLRRAGGRDLYVVAGQQDASLACGPSRCADAVVRRDRAHTRRNRRSRGNALRRLPVGIAHQKRSVLAAQGGKPRSPQFGGETFVGAALCQVSRAFRWRKCDFNLPPLGRPLLLLLASAERGSGFPDDADQAKLYLLRSESRGWREWKSYGHDGNNG